jgi:hypothetical protein
MPSFPYSGMRPSVRIRRSTEHIFMSEMQLDPFADR